jgi:hypothetical protein
MAKRKLFMSAKRSNVKRRRTTARTYKAGRSLFGGIPRTIQNNIGLLTKSPSRTVKLRYAEQQVLNPGVGSSDSYVYRLNNMYDTNLTGSGHQPRGFDQMAVFYAHYEVLSVSWTLTLSTDASATTLPLAGFALRRTNSTFTITDFLEDASSKYQTITAESPTKISGTCNIKKILGIVRTGTTTLEAAVDGGPTESVYLHLFAMGSNLLMNPSQVNITLELNFTAKFREEKVVGES